MIRLCAGLAALMLLAWSPTSAATRPRHIMTMDMCDDMLLLMLVPRDRIASITWLAHDAVKVLMPGADAGVAINHGTAEEILRQSPDLIIGSPWSTPMARRLAKKVGARLVEMDSPNDFDGIRAVVRKFGALVGEPARAEALVREMDADLARLAATRPARPIRVIAWSGSGQVPGKGTLTDAIITAAGADNIGATVSGGRYASFDLEELLRARPDAVMQGVNRYGAPALRTTSARHPLIDRAYAGRQIDYPDAGYTCGLPQTARMAVELRRSLDRLPKGPVAW